mgnify:CR=1 FL=1|jgi:glycosyltransferase involved in cell wall biosynthesis
MTAHRPKKLVLVTPYYWPAIGGLEHYAHTIAKGLQAQGWQVEVITSGKVAQTLTHEGIKIHKLATNLTFFNTPIGFTWTRQIKKLLADIKPDVINIHAPVPSMAIAAWRAAKSTPIVITYHAGSMRKGRIAADVPIWLFEHLVLPRMFASARHIIASSAFVQNSFLKPWETKTSVVTPGVDTQRFKSTDRTDFSSPVKLTFVGDARDSRKGLAVVLEAMAALPDCRLDVIGQAPEQPQERVNYVGQLAGEDLVSAYQTADIVILPSTTNAESFGMTLLEGMACGRPVIGSHIGGIPTLIEDGINGLLVAAGDADALVDAIERLKTDPALARKLGHNGRQTAVVKYDWRSRIKQTATILEASS